MIVVMGRRARLVRWDRAGAIVSESFDFVQDPRNMITFLYRYGHMDRMQRGYDPTVVHASEAEVAEMRRCRETLSAYHKECLDDAMEDGWPIYKILTRAKDIMSPKDLTPEVSNSQALPSSARDAASEAEPASGIGGATAAGNPCAQHYFLIGKPRTTSHSPTGRATRGYVAYDVSTKRLVFLKNTWRPASLRITPEGEVYKHLWKKGVEYIATPISAGDVYSDKETVQKTLTQDFLESGQYGARIHYHLSFKEVCHPLEPYRDSVDLMDVMLNTLAGQ